MGNLNYNTLRPFSSTPKGLPRLLQPYEEVNGKILGKTFQYQPSDAPQFWKDGGNLQDYTEDEMLYRINNRGFRGNQIVKDEHILMTAGCSHTYGIGVRNNEVWGHLLAEQLDLYHINIGVGGIGYDSVVLLIKQFIEEGVVPRTLAIFWPDLHRKMLITDQAKKLDDQITDFMLDPKVKFEPFVFQFASDWEWAQKHEKDEIDSAIKGYLLQTNQQHLFEFWIYRELVIQLCAKHHIKLIEAFNQIETAEYVKKNCHRKIPRLELYSPPGRPGYGVDLARDNMHFGAKSHSNIAKKFYNLLKT